MADYFAPPDAPPLAPPAAPPLAPADAPLDAPLDEPEVPPAVPADAPVPEVPDPVAPAVPAPVVPPPVPLPLSLFPPPALDRLLGTLVIAELVLLGLLLRTQSARAVPVNPAQDALGVVGDDEVVDPLGIDDVPDTDD